MKAKLLIVSLALPVLHIMVSQRLASIRVNKQGNIQSSRSLSLLAQATLDQPTSSQFYLAARDEQKKECEWVGICDQ